MVPEVRALADRFIYDTATLKYIAVNAPADALDRSTPGSGWTVRQTLAHLAENQVRYGETVARWLGEEPGLKLPGDPHAENAAAAERNASAPVASILAIFDRSVREIVTASDQIDESMAAREIGGWPVMRVLNAWASHAQGHAVDIVTALPELKADPMVLNWALHFDYSNEPNSARWQVALAQEVRTLFQLQGQEES